MGDVHLKGLVHVQLRAVFFDSKEPVSDLGQNKIFLVVWYRKNILYDFWPQISNEMVSFYMRVLVPWAGRTGRIKEEGDSIIFLCTTLVKGEGFVIQGTGTPHSDTKNEKMRIQQVWGRLLRKARLFLHSLAGFAKWSAAASRICVFQFCRDKLNLFSGVCGTGLYTTSIHCDAMPPSCYLPVKGSQN